MACRLFMVLALAAGCGDNRGSDREPLQTKSAASATSSVGGSQVAHSKSFMLVTSIATGDAQIARSSNLALVPGGQ
jgi:hypothetical protein